MKYKIQLFTFWIILLFGVANLFAQDEECIFINWEKIPEYKYGSNKELLEIMSSQIIYPTHNCIEGTTVLTFKVDTFGIVHNPIIRKSIASEVDEQLLKEIVDCEFIPGEFREQKVNFTMYFPFKVQSD